MYVYSIYFKVVFFFEYSIFCWFGKCVVFIVVYCDIYWVIENEVEMLCYVFFLYYYLMLIKVEKKCDIFILFKNYILWNKRGIRYEFFFGMKVMVL